MKYKKRAPKSEALSFHLADFIAGKLLLSRAYVLFESAWHVKKFFNKNHQLFLTTLPILKKLDSSHKCNFLFEDC
jgi:hypothetical protein